MDFLPKSLLSEVNKLKNPVRKVLVKPDPNTNETPKTKGRPSKTFNESANQKHSVTARLSIPNRASTTSKSLEIESDVVNSVLKTTLRGGKKTLEDITPIIEEERFENIGLEKDPIENEKVVQFKQQDESASYKNNLDLKIATTRKEVAQLKLAMRDLIKSLGVEAETPYPTEMHAFLSIIQEEYKIYDTVFKEIIRQVSVNMVERGEVLAEVRDRYANMFSKIPHHVTELHTELVAHRKLNRRLSEELIRAKDHISDLLGQLDFVREYDDIINIQAREAQAKMVSLLSSANSAEESMEEFHKLYRMQRLRLEKSLSLSEKEKRLWVDASTRLAIRIGNEYGIPDLLQLQKHEEARLRVTNHMIVLIGDNNGNDLSVIETKINYWRTALTEVSGEILAEDLENLNCLYKIENQMRKVVRNLITNQPENEIELGHRLLTDFHILDIESLAEHFQLWATDLLQVTGRYTVVRDIHIKQQLALSRQLTNDWIRVGIRLIRRNQDSSSGDEYLPLMDVLKSLQVQIADWTMKLQIRASGEDGIINSVLFIQSQIEDRIVLLSYKGTAAPLSPQERLQNIDALHGLIEQAGSLISIAILSRHFNIDI
jgi:hypothetical protein